MAIASETKIRLLHVLFIIASVLLMMCVIATPLILSSGVFPLDVLVLDEDLLESILIAVLFIIAGTIFVLYRRELRSLHRQLGGMSSDNALLKNRLADAFRYIGNINVQLERIHAVFAEVICYPQNRSEFKRLLAATASNVLNAVDKDWMLIRIVDRANLKTHIEHWEARRTVIPPVVPVSNRSALGQSVLPNADVIRSHGANAAVRAVCVFQMPRLNREERILMEAVAAEIEMVYTVFSSQAASRSQSEETAGRGS